MACSGGPFASPVGGRGRAPTSAPTMDGHAAPGKSGAGVRMLLWAGLPAFWEVGSTWQGDPVCPLKLSRRSNLKRDSEAGVWGEPPGPPGKETPSSPAWLRTALLCPVSVCYRARHAWCGGLTPHLAKRRLEVNMINTAFPQQFVFLEGSRQLPSSTSRSQPCFLLPQVPGPGP